MGVGDSVVVEAHVGLNLVMLYGEPCSFPHIRSCFFYSLIVEPISSWSCFFEERCPEYQDFCQEVG